MNAINSWIKRNPLIVIILCIALVIPLVGLVSRQTNGFENPEDLFTLERNEANLLIPGEDGNYKLLKNTKTDTGLAIGVKSNGALTVTGSNPMATTDVITVAKLTLKAGTYTLSSGCNTTSTATVYMNVMANSGELVKADFDQPDAGPGTFTLATDTEVEINLNVCAGSNHNYTLYPVLVADDEPGAFYAIQA